MKTENLNVLRQVVERGFGHADLDLIDRLISDHIIEHQFGLNNGKEGIKKAILSLKNAFSNRTYQLNHYVVSDDMVWVHYTATGEHTGNFMGHEPTGKSFAIDVIDIARIENGQVVEHWGAPDRFALITQLGFIPSPVKH